MLEKLSLAGRVAIVTGAGKGIGKATATALAEVGAKVLVVTRSEAPGEAVKNAIEANGGTAELAAIELGTPSAAARAVERAVELWGGLDIVVHNAAYIPYSPIASTSDEDWERAFAVGPSTAFWLARAAIPHMRARGGGRIVATSSLAAGYQMSKNMVPYGASKGALGTFVRGLALELAGDSVTVNAVAPGGTLSEGLTSAMSPELIKAMSSALPSGRFATCEEIASVIRFLASDEARFITGQTIVVDGGQSLGLDVVLDP